MQRFTLTFGFFFLFLLGNFATAHTGTPGLDCAAEAIAKVLNKRVTLRAGTLVLFETTSSLSSQTATVGSLVPLRVTTNVTVDGKTLVSSGTQAVGRITRVAGGTYNEPASMQLEVKFVMAVDGTQVTLSANPIDIKAPLSGEALTVQPLTQVSSMVMNDIEIDVK